MKKLILFLSLFISALADAQVVVPKSTTTFSNVRATGSMTVANKLRVGSTTAPSATLDVTGTMSVSSTATIAGLANLQGGLTTTANITTTGAGSLAIAKNFNSIGNLYLTTSNTSSLTTSSTSGTIAVLSDAVFPVQCFTGSQGATMNNPADGTTYYFVNTGYLASSTATAQTIVLPYNCVLVRYDINATVAAIVGSSETSTISIRVNNSTDVTLNSSVTFSNTSAYQKFSQNGLNTNFSANDAISIKWVCPTWVTNPTAVYLGVTLWFVRRQ